MRRLGTAILFCTATLALGAAAPAAGADGGPVPPLQGGAGVGTPGGDLGYVAVGIGGGRTLVERIERGAGLVERTRILPGRWGVGAVAFDGSATGLSADGSTLVLAQMWPNGPLRTTRLALLDPQRLKVRGHVALRGYWTLDAISPHGRRIYLLHYLSIGGLHYEVRAYDLARRHLVAKPVIDPREPDEKMQGIAVTRAMSADGRWAYTLYLRPSGGPPFVHALDTQASTARCVDLPSELTQVDLASARLSLLPGGGALSVDVPGLDVPVRIDTRTFAVSRPAPAAAGAPRRGRAPVHRPGGSTDGGGGAPAWVWMLAAVPLAALAALTVRRRVRAPRGRTAAG